MKPQIPADLDEILSDPDARAKIYSKMFGLRSKQENAPAAPALTVEVNGKRFDIRQLSSLSRKG